jgi:class 3 adenylate cyclase/predicted ATPase
MNWVAESADVARAEPPTGLIAMLFTDVEGSTRLATALGEQWDGVLGGYHEIVGSTVELFGGWVDETAGDGFFVTFRDVTKAGRAAVEMQRRLRDHPWPAAVGELKVRMGLHVGQVERRGHGYVGLEIHRAARIGSAAHGGQLLLSGAAAELLRDVVPSQPLGAHRLKDFPAPTALYCAVIDGRGAGDFAPPATLELRLGNVPLPPLMLIGREADRDRVQAALRRDGERLVTILGRGGMGKTSLAMVAANDLFEAYPGGVWWVDGAPERDATGLRAAIARGCRIEAEDSSQTALVNDLGSRGPLLLVIDNLETVPDSAEVLDSLLDRLPELQVLATSQLPVHSTRERRLALDRLAETDALALLERVAERLGVGLEDRRACAELVALLDGLPLAIELAAGRLRLFGPAELVRRLRQSMAILEDRTRSERHRSLTSALAWTLGLLDPGARELFARMGVFAGPVELQDVELVVGDGRDVFAATESLLDAALLHRVESGDGRVRFGFPEAIRQEAARALEGVDAERWRRAHAQWQRDLVWPLRIYEIAEADAVERAHGAATETHAAIAWAWERDRPMARQIAVARYALASRAGVIAEATALVERLLADPGDDPRVVDLVREHALVFHSSEALADRGEELISLFTELRDDYAVFLCGMNIAIVLTWERRYDEALAWADRSLELARDIGPLAEASMLGIKADTLLEAGRVDEAEVAILQSDAATGGRRSGTPEMRTILRAVLASHGGLHDEALDSLARVLTSAESSGDSSTILVALAALVQAFARAGRDRELLEAAGITRALVAERDLLNEADFAVPAAVVADALERVGPSGASILDAGRAVEPARRVKRACTLVYGGG